jgi:hypothetical protein
MLIIATVSLWGEKAYALAGTVARNWNTIYSSLLVIYTNLDSLGLVLIDENEVFLKKKNSHI